MGSIYNEAKSLTIKRKRFFQSGMFLVKLIAFIGIVVVCTASLIFVALNANNRIIQSQKLAIRALKKTSLLESRLRRNLASSSYNKESDDDEVKIRMKRTPSDDGETNTSIQTGVTYERWGRRDCSGINNELIYHGIVAGSYYSHTGGPSNRLCLHMNVTYTEGRYIDGQQGNAFISGAEYRDSSWVHNLFDLSLTEGGTLRFHSVPCAICLARTRFNKLMIPGRDTCPDGWIKEYTGYIMTGGYNDKHSSDAICVDDTPQVVPGTQGNQQGAYLHVVEAGCQSLLCEPFVNQRELSCVVCTI